jgi:hypothetical protein
VLISKLKKQAYDFLKKQAFVFVVSQLISSGLHGKEECMGNVRQQK